MERLAYLVRRLLLMVPTFLGITIACFALCQMVPGGPVEQAIAQMRGLGAGEGGSRGPRSGAAVSPEQRKALEAHFGFDKPLPVRYWNWLVRDRMGLAARSWKYPNKTVWELVRSRFRVSLVFGLSGFFLTYLVCIPLGIAKALRHGSAFDAASSLVVFVGYAIPAFAFGMLLKMLFAGGGEGFWDILPAAGVVSVDHAMMSPWGQFKDSAAHFVLPVCCYVIGNFAVLTLLTKNSLLEQIGQDYVRTARAKGLPENTVLFRHVLRNALIPILTNIPGYLLALFTGNLLLEKFFNIPGLGGFTIEAIAAQDFAAVRAMVFLGAVIYAVGLLLADIAYCLADPRIHY